MSTHMTGRLVADNGGTLTGLVGFRISARLPGSLFDFNGQRIGDIVVTQANGAFDIVYPRDLSQPGFRRQLELRVQDAVGRVVPFPTPTGRLLFDDIADERFDKGDVVVRAADATGLLATLGTGKVSRLSTGNEVTLLMDRDAFAYAAAMVAGAQKEIQMSQLFFALPPEFHANAAQDVTALVFDFHVEPGQALDLAHPRAVRPDDARPERLLIDAAKRGVDTRILLNEPTVPFFVKMLIGLLLFPFLGLPGFFYVRDKLGPELTDADEAERYFGAAGMPNVRVRPFEQSMLKHGVMHAKLMIVDGLHALSIGSPFSQRYVDTADHTIEAWIRGSADSYPVHDAGFKVSGPALGDMYATMKTLWDETGTDDLPAAPRTGAAPPAAGSLLAKPADATCAMQIVRTLSAGRFGDDDPGEKGILEAYQRAIAQAKDFIYLETQYFTNDAIGEALVEAMKARPQLQVIVLLNIEPDVFSYPFKQRRLITRIRRAIGQKANEGPKRFGVFTRWTHELGIPDASHPNPRPRVLPIYIHAKVGIVDNTWATVGSANLDGLSLDSSLPSDILGNLLNIGEQRAIEVNAVMLNRPTQESPVVDILRRKLWAEHLGFMKGGGAVDIAEPLLQLAARPADGWLGLWSKRADAMLKQLTDHPREKPDKMARVLPWPEDNSTYATPRAHITALGIHSYAVIPLKSTRAFDFRTGDWKAGSKARMDYD